MNGHTPSALSVFSLLIGSLYSTGCGSSNFRGSSAKKDVTPVAPVETSIPTKPDEACVKREVVSAVDVLFALDNSSSMLSHRNGGVGSDCADPENGFCTEATKREEAVTVAHTSLTAKERSFASLAGKNNLATLKFPASNSGDFARATAQTNASWVKLAAFQKGSLEYTRRPYGYTPFNSAFAEAGKLFAKVKSSGNLKLLVFITDGESTDPYSKTDKQLRSLLPEQTKVAVFMISNGKPLINRLEEHFEFLTQDLNFDPENAKIITSGEGLAKKLADPGMYFETSANELSTAVDRLVTVTTECE